MISRELLLPVFPLKLIAQLPIAFLPHQFAPLKLLQQYGTSEAIGSPRAYKKAVVM